MPKRRKKSVQGRDSWPRRPGSGRPRSRTRANDAIRSGPGVPQQRPSIPRRRPRKPRLLTDAVPCQGHGTLDFSSSWSRCCHAMIASHTNVCHRHVLNLRDGAAGFRGPLFQRRCHNASTFVHYGAALRRRCEPCLVRHAGWARGSARRHLLAWADLRAVHLLSGPPRAVPGPTAGAGVLRDHSRARPWDLDCDAGQRLWLTG